MVNKKIFCISDIHGCYKEMIDSLKEAGYNESDTNRLLLVLGDYFDRGRDSVAIYQYIKKLSDDGKAIVLKGNHDNMLVDYLNGKDISPFNYMRNGTNETIADFLGRTAPFESWCAIDKGIDNPTVGDFSNFIKDARDEINQEYPELLEWLETRPYYYETKNYIFTHGAIDTKVDDWHSPHCYRYRYTDWEALTWDDGSFFGSEINNTDKTVVIGHFGTYHLRQMYDLPIEKGKEFDILEREDGRVIAIDATTNLSKKVNVLVLEDELL